MKPPARRVLGPLVEGLRDAQECTHVRPIFGVDVDGEACRVAQLSLLLTLLDYVEPPDLTLAVRPLNCAIRKRRTSFRSVVSNVNMKLSFAHAIIAA